MTPWTAARVPGFPVLHHLLEFAQTHVYWISDAIQPSHPWLSPCHLTISLSHHQGLFQWVGPLSQVAKVLELQLQHQSFQWIFRVDSLAHGKMKAQGGHEICLRFYSCSVEPPDSFLMFNDNNWNAWISVHFLWNHDFMFFLFFCFSKRQRKNGSNPLHFVNKEAEAQKLKDLPRSHRKAGVELVPEAKCPECHSGSAASTCPLVLVTSASFRVGVKWRHGGAPSSGLTSKLQSD